MKFDSFDENNIDVELAEEKDPPKESIKEEKYDNLNKNQLPKDNRLDNKNNDNTANNKNNNQPNEKQAEPSEKQNHDYNTLDESVKATLNRDLTRIYYKLKHVLIPSFSSRKNEELQNWDLWGPLIICLALCIFLSVGRENDTNLTFIAIFVIMWIGGAAIAFNSIFLGGKIGICQSICLLGYCSFPMLVASIFVKIFSWAPPYAKVIIVALTYIWSCFSSVGFMSGLVPPSKKFVAVYPVFLFYLTLSGFILNY